MKHKHTPIANLRSIVLCLAILIISLGTNAYATTPADLKKCVDTINEDLSYIAPKEEGKYLFKLPFIDKYKPYSTFVKVKNSNGVVEEIAQGFDVDYAQALIFKLYEILGTPLKSDQIKFDYIKVKHNEIKNKYFSKVDKKDAFKLIVSSISPLQSRIGLDFIQVYDFTDIVLVSRKNPEYKLSEITPDLCEHNDQNPKLKMGLWEDTIYQHVYNHIKHPENQEFFDKIKLPDSIGKDSNIATLNNLWVQERYNIKLWTEFATNAVKCYSDTFVSKDKANSLIEFLSLCERECTVTDGNRVCEQPKDCNDNDYIDSVILPHAIAADHKYFNLSETPTTLFYEPLSIAMHKNSISNADVKQCYIQLVKEAASQLSCDDDFMNQLSREDNVTGAERKLFENGEKKDIARKLLKDQLNCKT